jgi:Mg-chelatase subunit ChlD
MMTNQEKLKKLQDYIRNYVKRVIGANYQVIDSPNPCSIKKKEPEIHLPLTETTLSEFLGEEFVQNAPPQLLFSIVIGLAYHEVAHLESGEKDAKPHLLNNLICDSNDLNYVPNRWKGSIPFTLALINTTHKQSPDTNQIPLQTTQDKLQALIHLTVTYMRKLRIKHNQQNVRNLPQDHPLFDHLEKTKNIAKKARTAPIEQRPKLVKQLHKILKDLWSEENKKDPQLPSLGKTLSEVEPELKTELTARDADSLMETLQQTGAMGDIKAEYDKTTILVKAQDQKEEQHKTQQAIQLIENYNAGHSDESEEIPETDMPPVEVDEATVARLRKALQPLLFERSIKRRNPSITGSKFYPGNFYQINTNPEQPKIKKEVQKISRALDEAEIILCFDRSGSMTGEKEEVTKQVAGTLYKAITTTPKAKIKIIGFDEKVIQIKGNKPQPISQVLKKINTGLTARGGTNLPQALLHTIKTIKNSTAHKKIVICLTDGDLNGTPPMPEQIRYAKHHNTQVYCIGVTGSEPQELTHQFEQDKVIYIEDITDLPRRVRELTLKQI